MCLEQIVIIVQFATLRGVQLTPQQGLKENEGPFRPPTICPALKSAPALPTTAKVTILHLSMARGCFSQCRRLPLLLEVTILDFL